MKFEARIKERRIPLEITLDGAVPHVEIAGVHTDLDLVKISPYSYSLIMENQSHYMSIRPGLEGLVVVLQQRTYHVTMRDELALTMEQMGIQDSSKATGGAVPAPIPGIITTIFVQVGDEVAAGDRLLVLEAMKMENEITAPAAGTIKEIHVATGATVEKGARLVDISA